MNYQEALAALEQGHKVRLPEWQGYWFKGTDGTIKVLTKDGDILDTPWTGPQVEDRTDWELAEGLSFGWALNALKNGKAVKRRNWTSTFFIVKQVPAEISTQIIPNMQPLPEGAKSILMGGNRSIKYRNQLLVIDSFFGNADSWGPTPEDLFAEDWQLVSVLH